MAESILSYKISRSSVEKFAFDLPDFDSVTMALPSGLYTTFRTYAVRTKVIGLRAHLDRLYRPAQQEGVSLIRTPAELRKLLSGILAEGVRGEARVRLILDMSREPGEMYLLVRELQALPSNVYREGVRVGVSETSREKPALKQTDFIRESSSERKRLGGEVFEILLTHHGRILEGVTSNFFYVHDGVLHTAGRGVLPGVTRQTIIDLAKQAGISVRYKALDLREIPKIAEAFITSSSRGIVPVVKIANLDVGNGDVGEVTKQLIALYEQRVLEIAESIV